ncbi:hypothetical protein KUTeg_002861 [Tegillarca granosa]|uniref:Uncharacterized protein n=1 Tax=Tegillarca granosa TaxID=220873 RepID=A0ABQ9FV61_TEGGR|nr:hypothetical protein KUTeg_002861 [Tegillarca granosa]
MYAVVGHVHKFSQYNFPDKARIILIIQTSSIWNHIYVHYISKGKEQTLVGMSVGCLTYKNVFVTNSNTTLFHGRRMKHTYNAHDIVEDFHINMLAQLALVVCIFVAESTAQRSCRDIYIGNLASASGTYSIFNRQQQPYTVYCDFHKEYGYTFISNITTVPINIEDLAESNEHVIVRILLSNGQQKEVKFEQITRYQSYRNLTFFYSSHHGFTSPYNVKMAPYIYLGFLPTAIAQNRNTQGYRANGVDYEFHNCDSVPNSYMVFYFNPHNLKPAGYYPHCCDTRLMHQWVDHSVDVPSNNFLPNHFFYFFEFHMGGCGGYAVPAEYHNVEGASIGFRFGILCLLPCCILIFSFQDSCKDIYMENSNNPSGTYTIMNRHNQAYTVYCEFHKGYGYTYISNTSHVPINIDDLHTTTQHVMVRILKTNGQQKETKMEQLTRYQSQRNLTLMYNRYTDFAAPLNIKMSPYIYLGFLPVSMAKNTNTQGYRANGVNHEYQNCDANPNSYLVFYFNPHNIGPSGYYTGCCNTPLMHQWIDHATVLPHNKYLDPHFYFFFEMHMGGCGGYAIPQEYTDVQGAAIGFRFGKYIL